MREVIKGWVSEVSKGGEGERGMGGTELVGKK